MTAPRDSTPAHIWDTLQRLHLCNKTQLAARLGVTRQTLARWIADTEAGQSPGKAASERAAQLLQATLRAAHSDVHAQWQINWDAIATIGGKR